MELCGVPFTAETQWSELKKQVVAAIITPETYVTFGMLASMMSETACKEQRLIRDGLSTDLLQDLSLILPGMSVNPHECDIDSELCKKVVQEFEHYADADPVEASAWLWFLIRKHEPLSKEGADQWRNLFLKSKGLAAVTDPTTSGDSMEMHLQSVFASALDAQERFTQFPEYVGDENTDTFKGAELFDQLPAIMEQVHDDLGNKGPCFEEGFYAELEELIHAGTQESVIVAKLTDATYAAYANFLDKKVVKGDVESRSE